MAWRPLEGVVTGVRSVREFDLRTQAGNVVAVTIANVGEGSPGAKDVLKRMIEGRNVTVFVNPSRYSEAQVSGEVHTANGKDVAWELLRRGAVTFQVAEGYTVSGYSECVNRIAEREARERRAGLWANAPRQR